MGNEELKPDQALLSVKNLSIGLYRGFKTGKPHLFSAVEDISFDIYPGEILALVGESGSGKSLTALAIPGLLGPNKAVTAGSIVYHRPPGIDLLTLPEKELEGIRGKEISIIFQEPFSSLNPLVRVGKQIAEVLELHGERGKKPPKNQIERQVRELLIKLKFPDPDKISETFPHQLSGGMCQRIMIAMAVILKPRLLIADEPTTALDKSTQEEIISLLKEINKDFGTSVLFISHDLSLVKNFSSRVLVIYSGRILENGSTEEVFLHPAHEYTKGLLGSIPGPGTEGGSIKRRNLYNIPGKIPSLEEGRPGGCPFHPRCGKAEPICKTAFPPEKTAGFNHSTRCILEAEK